MTTITTIEGGDGVPAEPDWSILYANEDDMHEAREAWASVVSDLRTAGTLSVANGHAIRRLADFRVQYERAARHVAENGAIIKAVRAKTGQFNPYWAVMKHADEAIRTLEAELGIPPTRRGKAKKVERQKKAFGGGYLPSKTA